MARLGANLGATTDAHQRLATNSCVVNARNDALLLASDAVFRDGHALRVAVGDVGLVGDGCPCVVEFLTLG